MAKVKNEKGEVAVLVSPGFGAGWYTWNTETPDCLTDPDIVALVQRNAKTSEIVAAAEEKWPGGYWGGARDLTIFWVAEGTQYRIDEYDGSETLYTEDTRYLVA